MQFALDINIDSKGLQNIYNAGQSVTLVKSVVGDPLAGGNLPIAWLAFQPLMSNVVTWVQNYSLYATTTAIQSGATIKMTSQTDGPAQIGWMYTFQGGIFTGASQAGKTYNVDNQMQNMFNFGLAQSALVNGAQTFAPLNAQPVLYNQKASFTPIETVSIFLSSYSNNGVVISQVASNALSVALTSQTPSAEVGFNSATNTFYLVGQSAAPAAEIERRTAARRIETAALAAVR